MLFKTEALNTLDRNDKTLAHIVAATKYIKTAIWAFSTLAELRDNLGNESERIDKDPTTKERRGFLRSLLLSRLLVYGNDLQGEWKEIQAEALKKSSTEKLLDEDRIITGLKILIPFLQDQRTTLLNDEVHFALDQLPVETRAGYVYNLITARRYSMATAEAKKVFDDLNGKQKTSRMHETLANLLYTVGTVHSYNYSKETKKRTSFKMARALYQKAEESLGIMLSNMPNAPKNTSFGEVANYFATRRVSAHNEGLFAGIQGGLAFIDMEYGDIYGARYDRAIQRYESVIRMNRFREFVRRLEDKTTKGGDDLRKGLNRKRIRMLAEGLIGKANAMAYSNQSKYLNRARHAYESTRKWLDGLKENSIFKRIIVRSYQGEADAHTLLTTTTDANKNYGRAIVSANKGLDLYMEIDKKTNKKKRKDPKDLPINDRKEIAKLHISKGAAEAKLCRIKISHQSYNTSRRIIDTITTGGYHYRYDASRRDIEEGIIKGHSGTNQEQTTCSGSKLGEGYIEFDDKNRQGFGASAIYNFNRTSSLVVKFDSKPAAAISDPYIPTAGDEFKNIEFDRPIRIGIDYIQRHERPPYNVGFIGGLEYNNIPYKVHLNYFDNYWSKTIMDTKPIDKTYMNLGVHAAVYGELGKKLGLKRKWTLGAMLTGSAYPPLSENPILGARKTSNEQERLAAEEIPDKKQREEETKRVELKRKTIDNIEVPVPFSATATAYGRISFDSSFFKAFSKERYFMLQSPTIFAKLSAGYDTAAPTEKGTWLPDGKFAGFVRGSVGASTALVWKKHYSVTGSAEVGVGGLFGVIKGEPINKDENLTINASGNLTFKHTPSNNFAWSFGVGGYYYKSQDIEGGAFTLGVGLSF